MQLPWGPWRIFCDPLAGRRKPCAPDDPVPFGNPCPALTLQDRETPSGVVPPLHRKGLRELIADTPEQSMIFHVSLGFFLSMVIGLSLGLLGGGGSIITVPVLTYVIGVPAHQAIGMSLAVVGLTSLVGALMQGRQGSVRLSTGLLFGGVGLGGAYFGSRLTYLLSPHTLLLLFAALMLTVGVLMLLGREMEDERHARASLTRAVLAGLAVGVLTGFLGVGGGFLIVPALILFGGLSTKEAIGTSLVVIAINAGAGLLGHLQHGGFDLHLAGWVTAFALVGMLLGIALGRRIPGEHLRRGFAVFIIAVALLIVAQNIAALLYFPD
jgi:uncharacterized membrane protein YfcA